MNKICTKCQVEKSVTEFVARKDRKCGCRSICKECEKIRMQEYRSNPDIKKQISISKRKWELLHADERKKKLEKYMARPDIRAHIRERNKKYFANRRKNDPLYKLSCNIRSRMLVALKQAKSNKFSKSFDLTGCDIKQLMTHLESLFQPGMTWQNHGIGGWHIDHIKPCASFDLTKESEQRACFHYSNLQPLWEKENFRKGSKVSPKVS